jgi:hypothetical protein
MMTVDHNVVDHRRIFSSLVFHGRKVHDRRTPTQLAANFVRHTAKNCCYYVLLLKNEGRRSYSSTDMVSTVRFYAHHHWRCMSDGFRGEIDELYRLLAP